MKVLRYNFYTFNSFVNTALICNINFAGTRRRKTSPRRTGVPLLLSLALPPHPSTLMMNSEHIERETDTAEETRKTH